MDTGILIIAVVVALAAFGTLGYALFLLKKLRDLRTQFTQDHQPVNLEEILNAMAGKLKRLEGGQEYFEQALEVLVSNARADIQKVGVVRFNSLSDQGGNLSFALALLDGTDAGVVITNLHGRENSRTYAKPIVAGSSETPLTDEEKQAVLQATTQWHENVRTLPQNNKEK
jgi:hypothetical protein